jgi:GTPase SAR1 family protein
MVNDVPKRVVELVQEVLDQQEALVLSEKSSKNKKTDNKTEIPEVVVQKKENVKKVMLNIWDFAGQSAYYTTHQVNIWDFAGQSAYYTTHQVNI